MFDYLSEGNAAMRKASLVLAGALSSVPVVAVSTAAAADDTIIGDAVAGLSSGSNPYVAEGTSISSQGDLSSALHSADAAVVVVNPYQVESLGSYAVANQILQNAGSYSTVIVVNSGAANPFAVASVGDVAPINAALQANFKTTHDPGQAILASMDTITAAGTVTSTQHSSSVGAGDGGGHGVLVGGSIFIGLAILGTAAALFYRKARGTITKNNTTQVSYDNLPEDMKKTLQDFRRVVVKHTDAPNSTLDGHLQSILGNVQELFKRIDRKGNDQLRRMTAVTYIDIFTKLTKALGEDYYLDIMAHPNLWDNARGRMAEVESAAAAVDDQLVQNIRQVNASQDLDFKVALESLTRSMETPTVNDLYSPTTEKENNR